MFKLFNVNKQTVRVFFLAWRSLKQTSWTLEEPGTRRFRKLACASPEGPTPVLGTRDSRRRLPSPTGGTCSSVTSGLTPCLRANEKGFEHEAVTAKPPVSPDLSLSLGPQGGAGPAPTCGRRRSSRGTRKCGCRRGTARRPLCRAHTRSPWPGTAAGGGGGQAVSAAPKSTRPLPTLGAGRGDAGPTVGHPPHSPA